MGYFWIVPLLHSVSDIAYRSFATGVAQLKMCDFSRETFKGFEVECNDDTTSL
jgi:hypothetical protein